MTRKHSHDDPNAYLAYPSEASPPQASTMPAPPPEPTPEERVSDLLKTMALAAKHNSPVTPLMLSEVTFLVGHITGKAVAVLPHPVLDDRGHPGNVTFRKPDGSVEIVDTVEEALAIKRSLPLEVQSRHHWVVAEKELAVAVVSIPGFDTSPAIRRFLEAVAKDRELEPARPVEIAPLPAELAPPPPPAPEAVPAPGPA